MKYSLEKFEAGLAELNISLSEKQKEQFITYYEMLVEKNKVMNLTAITEFEEVIEKHFLDSLALSQIQNLNNRTNVLDLGTGAGFPAFPIKIVYPNIEMFLVEPRTKRYAFLQMAARELGLEKMHSYKSCIESVPVNHVDLVISKAFAPILKWIDIARPWAELGAQVACLVSQNDWNRAIPQINKIYKTSALIQSRDRVYARCLLLSTHDPFTLA